MLGFSAQANAFIRHLYSFLGGGLAFAAPFMALDSDTQAKIIAAVHQIGDGFMSILTGIGVLAPIVMGLIARFTAKPEQQKAAVEAAGNVVVPVSGDAKSVLQSSAWGPLLFLMAVGAVASPWLLLLFVGAGLLALFGRRMVLLAGMVRIRYATIARSSAGMLALLLVAAPMLGGCATNAAGQKVVDPSVLATVQAAAKAICGVVPTAAIVANLYTNNADVKTAESAATLACALAVPGSVAPSPPAAAPATGG